MSLLNEHFQSSSFLIAYQHSILLIIPSFLKFSLLLSSVTYHTHTHRHTHTHTPLLLYLCTSYFQSLFVNFLISICWHFSRLGFKCFSFLILYYFSRWCYGNQVLPSSTITYMQMTPKFMWWSWISTLSHRLIYPTVFSTAFLGCLKGCKWKMSKTKLISLYHIPTYSSSRVCYFSKVSHHLGSSAVKFGRVILSLLSPSPTHPSHSIYHLSCCSSLLWSISFHHLLPQHPNPDQHHASSRIQNC